MALRKEFTVFLVDDEPMYLKVLNENLSQQKMKYKVNFKTFSSGEECLENLHQNPDIIVLDYYMDSKNKSAMNGIDTLKKIKEKNPNQQVVMLSGQDKIDVAVDTMKFGAFDYVVKNESAFMRSTNAIKNVINNLKNIEMLGVYRIGFWVVTFILVAVLILFTYLAIYHPNRVFPDVVPA